MTRPLSYILIRMVLLLIVSLLVSLSIQAAQQSHAMEGTFGERFVRLADRALGRFGDAAVHLGNLDADEFVKRVKDACLLSIEDSNFKRATADIETNARIAALASDTIFQILIGACFTFLGAFLSWLLKL